MSKLSSEVRQIVAVRAHHICEYCLIAEADAFFSFQIEHNKPKAQAKSWWEFWK